VICLSYAAIGSIGECKVATIIQFPRLADPIVEDFKPLVEKMTSELILTVTNHLLRNKPELLAKHGVKIVEVWASFMLSTNASVLFEAAVQSAGSQEEYYNMVKEVYISE
jgi:hypothetical protein